MDIKTFLDCARVLPANISVLVRGDHGIGKSQCVFQLGKHFGLEVIDRRVSQCTEGDIVGLPMMDGNCTRFMPPDWIKKACDMPVVLFLDEINRATQEVMQACFQIVLDREINGNKLHPDTRVFAAVNSSASYQVNEMDPALLDRFFVVDLEPTADDFFAWGDSESEGNLDKRLLRFLKEKPSRLDSARNANQSAVQPSRRSWARFDSIAKKTGLYDVDMNEDLAARGRFYNLAVGMVGIDCAQDVANFLATQCKRYVASDVLDSYLKHKGGISELGQDKLNGLIDLIVEDCGKNTWQVPQVRNLGRFSWMLPGELRTSLLSNIAARVESKIVQANLASMQPYVIPSILDLYGSKMTAPSLDPTQEEEAAQLGGSDAAATPDKKSRAKKAK